jgi:hypothetical protein
MWRSDSPRFVLRQSALQGDINDLPHVVKARLWIIVIVSTLAESGDIFTRPVNNIYRSYNSSIL